MFSCSKALARQLSGTMFAMVSSDTPCTSRRSLMLFHIRRTWCESGNPLRTCLQWRQRGQQEPPIPLPPCFQLMLTSSALQPTLAQALQPPWIGSPERVGGAATSIDSSGTRPRRATIFLLSQGCQAGFPTPTSRCCLPFGMQAGTIPGPSLAQCTLSVGPWSRWKSGWQTAFRACGNIIARCSAPRF